MKNYKYEKPDIFPKSQFLLFLSFLSIHFEEQSQMESPKIHLKK